MKLLNDYKILYEKITEETKAGYASKNLPWDETSSKVTLKVNGTEVHLSDYKLIYEKDGIIYGNVSGLPAESDDMISGIDEEGAVVFGNEIPSSPHTVSISDDSVEFLTVEGTGEYNYGDAVEVKFTVLAHYDAEHVLSDVNIPDLVDESGSDTSKWVKATFTMPNSNVVLTLSAVPMILLQTEFPYDHTEGFGSHEKGETNIMLRIYGLPEAGDAVHYNAVAVDKTGTERGLDLTCDYGDYFETMLTEMPETDTTVTIFNDAV